MAELEQYMNMVDFKIWYHKTAIEAVTEAIHRPCQCQNEYITYVSAKKERWK
jgi:hypothetical protein